MIQMQVMPPADGLHPDITVHGRKYSCAVGSIITVPFDDGKAMCSNGWTATCAGGSGPSSDRPTPQRGLPGAEFHDTTIGAIIRWDGRSWRNVLTGAAV